MKKKSNRLVGFGLIGLGLVLLFYSGVLSPVLNNFFLGEIFTPQGFEEHKVSNSKVVYSIIQVKPIPVERVWCPGELERDNGSGFIKYFTPADGTSCHCIGWNSHPQQLDKCKQTCASEGGVLESGRHNEACVKHLGTNYGDYVVSQSTPRYNLRLSASARNIEVPPNQDVKIVVNAKFSTSPEYPSNFRGTDYLDMAKRSDSSRYADWAKTYLWNAIRVKLLVDGKEVMHKDVANWHSFSCNFQDGQARSCYKNELIEFNLNESIMKSAGLHYGGYHNFGIGYEVLKGNGEELAGETVTGYDGKTKRKYQLNLGSGVILDGLRFYREPDECTIPPGYSLTTVDLPAGTTFSKDSLGKPVVAFCNSYPVWRLDNSGKTLIQKDSSNLQLLRDGSYLTVPASEVWRIMFVAKTSDLTRACEQGEMLDSGTGQCVPMPAFEYLCEKGGTFNPVEMACLTQPVSRCVVGTYNEFSGLCELVGGTCPEGSQVVPLDGNEFKCIFKPIADCSVGVESQDELGRAICKYFPETRIVDENTKAYIREIEAKLSSLQTTLKEKVALLDSLNATLDKKNELIQSLNMTLEEKVQLIKDLNASIAEKAMLVKSLKLSLAEKASLVDSLKASLEEKASLIDSLQSSLAEKASLIDSLKLSLQEKASLIDALNASLKEKQGLIDSLNLSLQEKAELINSLKASLAEKAKLIDSLNASLEEKASLIKSLKLSLDEKAELIDSLNASLEEKASLIDAISANLQEKKHLILSLQASIEEKNRLIELSDSNALEQAKLVQALSSSLTEKEELIASLKSSLAEKASLIDSLNASLEEKGKLIGSLELSLQEKAELINSLKLSLHEKEKLVESLHLSLQEKEKLVKSLQLSLQEKTSLINDLNASLAEKASLVKALSSSLEEKASLIDSLKLSLQEKASLVKSLSSSLEEKGRLIQSLDLSLKEKAALIDSLHLSLDEKQKLIDSLNLSLQERAKLVNALKASIAEKDRLLQRYNALALDKFKYLFAPVGLGLVLLGGSIVVGKKRKGLW